MRHRGVVLEVAIGMVGGHVVWEAAVPRPAGVCIYGSNRCLLKTHKLSTHKHYPDKHTSQKYKDTAKALFMICLLGI